MAPVDSRDYVCLLSEMYYFVLVRNVMWLVNTRRRPNGGLMLAHRLRRWPSIRPALDQRLVFAGLRAGLLVVTTGWEYKPTPTQVC